MTTHDPKRYATMNRNRTWRGGLLARLAFALHGGRRDLGAAVAQVALLGSALVLITGVVVVRGVNSYQATETDRGWEESLHVAESGAEVALSELDADHKYMEDNGFTVDETTDLDTKDAIVVAAESLAASEPAALLDLPEGEVVVFEQENQSETKLYAVGFSPSMDAEDRVVRVVETEYEVTWNAFHAFPPGALVSEGNVHFTGNGRTVTVPSPPHEADIHSNRNVTGTGNAGVDGDISAGGVINGVGAAGDTTPGAEPVEFPEVEVVDMWREMLLAEAQTGPTLGTISSSRIIDAPAYIAGSIRLSGSETLVVNGPGTVFIAGGIDMSGSSKIINNGAMIATDGIIEQSGGSSYEVQGDPGAAGLVTFSNAAGAIRMTGGSSGSAQGIVYAPNGGVEMTGGAWFEGAIIAGGPQGVQLTGGASIRYPAGLLDGASALPPAADGVELEGKQELTVSRASES